MARNSFEKQPDLNENLHLQSNGDIPALTDDRVLAELGNGNQFLSADVMQQQGHQLTELYLQNGMMGDMIPVGSNMNPQTGKPEPDYLLVPAWGYENNGHVLLASNLDSLQHKQVKESDTQYNPMVLTPEVMAAAEHLGNNQTRWRPDHNPQGPKCNLYVDAVMKASGMPRPWAESGPALSQDMDVMLAKDPRYDKPWSTDYSHQSISRQNWQYFDSKPGDILIWNTPDGIVHSGIADGHDGIYSAGSHSPTGFKYNKIEYFTGTVETPLSYGPPTSVYRYINQNQ